MMGQYAHFSRYAPEKLEYAIARYSNELKRLIGVLEKQLKGKEYVCGEYSIADMAIYPWVYYLPTVEPYKTMLENDCPNVTQYV